MLQSWIVLMPVVFSINQTPLLALNQTNLFSTKKTGNFIQITDLHIDPLYVDNGSFDSQCHKVARHPGDGGGKFGTPESGCDSPVALIEETFKFIKKDLFKHHSGLDFVFWTGDNARHDGDSENPRTLQDVYDANKLATNYMLDTFTNKQDQSLPLIPIIPSFGNNDVHPHNCLRYVKDYHHPLIQFFADIWKPFIPKSQMSTFKSIGCFKVDLEVGKLQAVSLNTIYLSQKNKFSADCSPIGITDHNNGGDVVLDWLEYEVLKPARDEGMSVYITGHIPPNERNYFNNCNKRMNEISVKYRKQIKGQFYGHMNVDHFYFPVHRHTSLEDDTMQIMAPRWVNYYFNGLMHHYRSVQTMEDLPAPVFVSPSVVPAFNPGLRVYHYSTKKQTIGILHDYTQYFVDLVKWNNLPHPHKHKTNPFFEIEYQPKSAYDIYSELLTTTVWKDLAKRLGHLLHHDRKQRSERKRLIKLRQSFFRNLVIGIKRLIMPELFEIFE